MIGERDRIEGLMWKNKGWKISSHDNDMIIGRGGGILIINQAEEICYLRGILYHFRPTYLQYDPRWKKKSSTKLCRLQSED
jgi:hypothetical protein